MKAISLLLLRVSTGLYLALWGIDKLIDPEHAVNLSNRFYGGLMSSQTLNYGVGLIEIAIGLLVMLGLFRGISYLGQIAFYLIGIVPIIGYILDPFGMYLVENGRLTWFPSTTLLFASLLIITFKAEDKLSLDHRRKHSNNN